MTRYEVLCDPKILDTKSYGYQELMSNPNRELRQDLIEEVNKFFKLLTKRQNEVLTLLLEGKNTREIGIILGIHHTTVSNHIRGKGGRGGIIKKLQKYSKQSDVIQDIISQIN